MKMRTGFVSNSSSSSFILVVKKEIFEKEIVEVEQNVIKDLILKAFDFHELFGVSIAVYSDMTDRGGNSYWDLEIEEAQMSLRELADPDEECDAYGELDKFLTKLKLRSGEENYLESTIDM